MAPSTRSAALFAAFAVFLLVFTCTASALLVPPRVNAMLDLESNSGSKHAQSAAQLPLATDSTTNEAPIFLQRSPSTYEGHALVRIEVAGQRQKAKEVLDVLNAIDADIWAVQSKAEEGGVVFITARLSPEQRKLVEAGIGSGSTSNDVQVKLTIKHHNLQHVVDAESRQLLAASAESDDPANPAWFTQYHRYPAVLKFYKYLAEKNPDLVSVVDSVGKTHEGRNLFAVHLTSTKSNNTAPKKMIWWQSNIHAREWISGATTQYLIHTLVDEYKKGVDWVVELLDNVEIVLIPIVNPDGNEYTWTNSRLWRKNRNPTKFGAVGVDINRNYPEGWNAAGGSNSPFSEIYQGPSAASEAETKALTSYFLSMASTIIGAIDFHSYSQLVLRPWGYKDVEAPDESKLKAAGDIIRKGIFEESGKKYTNEREIDLYPASGTAEDWFYGSQVKAKHGGHRTYGFTVELRPSPEEGGNGGEGFILPPKYILPTGREIYSGLKGWFKFVRENDLGEK